MRHQKTGRRLSRTSSHRHAMWSNMVTSLIMHGRIETTEPKAKELKRIAERTIAFAIPVADIAEKEHKKLTQEERVRLVNAKRNAGRVVRDADAITHLFHTVGPLLAPKHKGGFTRLLKTRFRTGDAAPMAFVELVERPGVEAEEGVPAPQPEDKPKKKPAAEAKGKKDVEPAVEKPAKKPRAPKKKKDDEATE